MAEEMVTISVKIPKTLKMRLKRNHMRVSRRVRNFLETEALKEEADKLDVELRKHKKIFNKIKMDDVVEDLRNDRYNSDR